MYFEFGTDGRLLSGRIRTRDYDFEIPTIQSLLYCEKTMFVAGIKEPKIIAINKYEKTEEERLMIEYAIRVNFRYDLNTKSRTKKRGYY